MGPSIDLQQDTFLRFFILGFGTIFVITLAVIITGVALTIRRRHALRRAGLNPLLTGQEQIAARMSVAPRSTEERLAELDDLLRREVITPQEHAAARARILGS